MGCFDHATLAENCHAKHTGDKKYYGAWLGSMAAGNLSLVQSSAIYISTGIDPDEFRYVSEEVSISRIHVLIVESCYVGVGTCVHSLI